MRPLPAPSRESPWASMLGQEPPPAAAPAQDLTKPTPVYRKWWFWTVIGVAAAGAAAGVTAGVLVGQQEQPYRPEFTF